MPTVAIALVTETDSALSLTVVRGINAGLVSETDTALSITPERVKAIGIATETNTALPLLTLGIAIETDTALPIVATKLPFYPQQLPGVRVSSYGYQESPTTRSNDAGIGELSYSLLSEDQPTFFNVSWLFTAVDFRVFEGWFRWRLARGTRLFCISLDVGKGYAVHTCQFTNGYQVKTIGKLYQVNAELVSQTKVFDTSDQFEDVLLWVNGVSEKNAYGLYIDLVDFTNNQLPNAWENIKYGTDYS